MALTVEFHASNAKRYTKTLTDISDTILSHLGYPQQCIGEITPDEIQLFILDSLNFVSQYKPKMLQRTFPAAGWSGKVTATGIFYPPSWKTGDDVPEPSVRHDALAYVAVNPATSIHGEIFYNGLITDNFQFAQMGMGVRMEGSQSPITGMHQAFDNFLDFQLMYQNMQGLLSTRGKEFDWQQDYNDKGSFYYANLNTRVNSLTVLLALEHSLGNKYYIPDPTNDEVGNPVIEKEETITGAILYLTQNLALSKAMKKIGMVRTKIQGGMNQFQLNGDTMLQEGNILEERTIEEIKAGGDLWGTMNDQF